MEGREIKYKMMDSQLLCSCWELKSQTFDVKWKAPIVTFMSAHLAWENRIIMAMP